MVIHGNQQALSLGMDACLGSGDLGIVQDQKIWRAHGTNPPVFVYRLSSANSGFVSEVFSP